MDFFLQGHMTGQDRMEVPQDRRGQRFLSCAECQFPRCPLNEQRERRRLLSAEHRLMSCFLERKHAVLASYASMVGKSSGQMRSPTVKILDLIRKFWV